MPGKGHRFTTKQDREARHIAESMQKAHPGMSPEKAKSIGYATINKQKKAKKGK
jgi:4-hydroxy-3-methylbut-2-enyl diphosphate reductase IspH